jgi:diguanylate cyclase (GGDEF)-like protein
MRVASKTLSLNVQLLKARVNKYAYFGVAISILAIIIATTLSGYFELGVVDLETIIYAQKTNSVLWFLDSMPFLFSFWGQYVGTMMAYEAGALVMDQTHEFRSQTVALEHQVMHDATHDSLTDLPNRILFHDRVKQAIYSAKREKGTLAILLLDLDRFKEINDTMGHFNGDRLLKQVSLRLSGVTRESDTLARLGGDEFAILFPKIREENDIHTVAKKIQNSLLSPFVIEGLTLDVQASLGAVLFPQHGEDVDTLIQRADVAMYVAKNENKGFVIYSPKMDQYSPHRLTLMSELRQAIEQDDLLLYYQPKINVRTDQITDVEVLIRWQHKDHGMIAPDEFISLAERTGLIKQLTRWVLKNALQQAVLWRKSGTDIGVAVNLSTKNLLDPEFPDIIAGLLASYDLQPKYLILEITETAIMADPEMALEVLTRIAKMGVRISVDDFGTGYSSLSYLKKLPVGEIKIDKSFVTDMLEKDNDAVIVHATIELAHNLGLEAVAEGVENEETLLKLKELGCDVLQGFHICKPIPAKDLTQWLESSPWRRSN